MGLLVTVTGGTGGVYTGGGCARRGIRLRREEGFYTDHYVLRKLQGVRAGVGTRWSRHEERDWDGHPIGNTAD